MRPENDHHNSESAVNKVPVAAPPPALSKPLEASILLYLLWVEEMVVTLVNDQHLTLFFWEILHLMKPSSLPTVQME